MSGRIVRFSCSPSRLTLISLAIETKPLKCPLITVISGIRAHPPGGINACFPLLIWNEWIRRNGMDSVYESRQRKDRRIESQLLVVDTPCKFWKKERFVRRKLEEGQKKIWSTAEENMINSRRKYDQEQKKVYLRKSVDTPCKIWSLPIRKYV